MRGSRGALLGAIGLFAALFAAVIAASLSLTGGHLGYALDDGYIHLAMARQFAEHGVWGVTRYAFSSSSSAPLWTLLLGLIFRLTGPFEALPLLLNAIAAVGVIVVARRILQRLAPGASARTVFLGLAAVVLFTPLVPLVFMGQEHTLHLLLTLVFAHLAAQRLIPERRPASGETRAFYLLAAIMPMVRYESLFLILATAGLLAWRRRSREALVLVASGLLTPIAYGLFCVSQGGFLLPNPILIKANLPGKDLGGTLRTVLGYTALHRLFANAHLVVPILAALLLLVRRAGTVAGDTAGRDDGAAARAPRTLLGLFVIATALHLTLADVGWFYRYEAYLVGLSLVALVAAASTAPGLWGTWTRGGVRGSMRALAAVALGIVCLGALADRGVRAVLETPRATANIYEQQYQIGRFLRDAYPGASVAMNDVGAVNYLADIRCLDLVGLASADVAAHIRAGTYNPRALDQLMRDHAVRIAVLYDEWIRIPSQWRRVGSWTIRKNVVAGGTTVSFYALDPAEAAPLAQKLKRFAPQLPATVEQSGSYLVE